MSKIKKYYALVQDLSQNEEDAMKILLASEMFKLKPNNDAVRLKPKHDADFNKKEEYGRKRVLDGAEQMVRHKILEMNGKCTPTRRFSFPPSSLFEVLFSPEKRPSARV